MAQLHINVPNNIKNQAQDELKKHGLTMTSKIKMILYRLARLNRLSQKISTIPKETKKLSTKAKRDINDHSTATSKRGIKE